jgi:hypothetical protein|tara:strand:+ start:1530 stop:2273 length:744 start_codon:yes stop_codon:yes gene_type:complete
MEPIKKLEGKTVAIVGMGKSWFDYNLAKSHGAHFDEVWAINAVASVIFHDRVFMMDPPSRFLETDDAGGQTDSMTKLLQEHEGPIYTCELDEKCPGLVEYPIEEVLGACGCHYLNNTVSYAVAFAIWNKVEKIKMFGVDFGYKGNLYFAEAGRASVEFWLSKAMNQGIQVEVAHTSYLLDTAVPNNEKLYGYHRLDDPLVVITNEHGHLIPKKQSEVMQYKQEPEPVLVDRNDTHLQKNKVGEPNKW